MVNFKRRPRLSSLLVLLTVSACGIDDRTLKPHDGDAGDAGDSSGGTGGSSGDTSGGTSGKGGSTTGGSAGKGGSTTGGSAGKGGSTTGGTSDGRFIASICPQVVEFGPCNASIHKVDERVAIADIDALRRVYQRVLARLLMQG